MNVSVVKRTGSWISSPTYPIVLRLLLAVGLLAPPPVRGAGNSLVPAGAIWKYLDSGTNLATAWRSIDFEDDSWGSGPAQLGYGDGDEATEVKFGPSDTSKYITTYFRHIFEVTDATEFTNLTLRLLRDDGAVVYLNGTEVFRSNMPLGLINYLTLAASTINDLDEATFYSTNVNPALLVSGRNILAVEVHQRDPASSDLSFDLELDAGGNNASPVVVITIPAKDVFFPLSSNILVVATASDPDGVITNLEIFVGNQLLAQGTNSPMSFDWTNAVSGTHTLIAQATDDRGLSARSAPAQILVSGGLASTFTLVPAGSIWKYLDHGSNQPIAWRDSGFDDSSWASGRAKLGYGDGDESTVVSYGPNTLNKYITTYFRHTFVVPEGRAISNLIVRLLRDDGAVVYLNGVEILRNNMPAVTITSAIFASTAIEDPYFARLTVNAGQIVGGTNVLAVEVHQASGTSSDLSFDLELLGSDYPLMSRGPWLQTATPTSVIIKWHTDAPANTQVRYGTTPAALDLSASSATFGIQHEVAVSNLLPATTYYYSINTPTAALTGGDDYHFTTPPVAGTRKPTRIWVIGDSGTANLDAQNVRDAYYRFSAPRPADLWLMLGDNAYDRGTDSEYQKAVFDTYPTLLRNTALWSTIGNHETDQSPNPSPTIPYFDIFTLPRNGEAGGLPSGTENYYSFDYANIHFVCLDAMASSRATSGPMLTWLRNDLAATTQDWLIAYWHHPPYSKGSHDSDLEINLIEMRQNALPILEAFGVDLVLCGHSHAYERSFLLNGHYGQSSTLATSMKVNAGSGRVDATGAYNKLATGLSANRGAVYVVAGSASKITGGLLNHPAMFLSLNRLGSLVVDIDGDRLDATFLRETGQTNDYFTILKGPALSIGDVTVREGDAGTVDAVFTVSLSTNSDQAVTVEYATVPGTALPATDYDEIAGTLTFLPGTTTRTVTVPVLGGNVPEPDERFSVRLFNSMNADAARVTGIGAIRDNDNPPRLKITRTAENQVLLSWPDDTTGFVLERATSFSAPDWGVATPSPVIVANQNLVTNELSGSSQYFRLRKP